VAPASLPSAFTSPTGEAAYLAAYEASMRLWTTPYTALDLRSRFGTSHLVRCGPTDAPPLLLLHCYFTSLTSWVNNVADLSRDHRVLAPDMMGQPGRSVPDQPIRNRDEMAEWLTGILDELGIAETDLAGYSYGGFAALNLAMRAPNRVKKLVLLAPAGGLFPLKKQFFIRGAVHTLGQALHLDRLTMTSLFRWMFYEPNLKDARLRPVADCIFDQMYLGAKYFRRAYSSPKNFVWPTVVFTDEELRAVTRPTLLLIGRQEALYDPIAAVARARRLMPDIRAEIIPEAGHDLPVSQHEIVDQRMLAFLAEGAGHPPSAGIPGDRVTGSLADPARTA
jgi:pimeloyl-ACP methyl ester carboxylesterase